MINCEYLPGYMLNEEINPQAQLLIDQLKPVYREAFAGEPWYELTKCASPGTESAMCTGALSAIALNQECAACLKCPSEIAYTDEELDEKFKQISRKDSMLYLERNGAGRLLMAAIAYKATASAVADEKYSDVPEMQAWLAQECGEKRFVWLDEVFADRGARKEGNLERFAEFVPGLAILLDMPEAKIRYRTISPAMTKAPQRFGDGVRILDRIEQVPDRRDFVTIDLSKAV